MNPETKQAALVRFEPDRFISSLREVRDDDYLQIRKLLNQAEGYGRSVFQKSAQKNRHLQLSLQNAVLSRDSMNLVEGLNDLNEILGELDPSRVDFHPGFFKRLFNPLSDYFERYEQKAPDLNRVLTRIQKGRNILSNDTITLQIEKEALLKLISETEELIANGTELAHGLTELLYDLRYSAGSANKISWIEQQVMPGLEQRLFDLKQLYIVCQQQVSTIDIILHSNRELLRAVDRAQGITLSAMHTAILLASSLNNQKIILEKVQELEKKSGKVLARNGLQPDDGQEVSPEVLKQAFEETFEALDDLDSYNQKARETLNRSLQNLKELSS